MTAEGCRRGSLTIEAAAILPLFALGLLTILSVIPMINTGSKLQEAVFVTAEQLAVLRSGGDEVSLSDIEDAVRKYPSDGDCRYIRDGREGISVKGSVSGDPEYTELAVSCDLVPVVSIFGALSVPFERRCLAHVWCGYEKGFFPEGEFVYITADSAVYHNDRDCSHLHLSVKEADAKDIPSLRNGSGSRYKPCESCHAALSDKRLYITEEGDRYHNSITCSGLKRTVYAVRLGDVRNRRPCSRCGR